MDETWSDPQSKVTSFFTGSCAVPEDEDVVLKDYVIGQRLGEGAYGSVYAIKHMPSGKPFALKILQKQDLFVNAGGGAPFDDDGLAQCNLVALTYAEAFEKKIVQEATVMQALQHPHVVNFYRFLNSKEAYYFIMELAEGGELFDLVISSHHFVENEARFYFQQLMSAIEYCHRNGVAHGDLKAENLLLSKDNRLLVCDFGFSSKNVKENVDDPEATLGTGDNAALLEGLVNGFSGVGTLHYMSPEAIRATTERVMPEALLNLAYEPSNSQTGSPDAGSLSSPARYLDATDSFTSGFTRRDTSFFTSPSGGVSHSTTPPTSMTRRAQQSPGVPGTASSPTVPHTTVPPAMLVRSGASPLASSNGKALRTSYSMADVSPDAHARSAHHHHASRSGKVCRHSSTRTLNSSDRAHTSSYGETISSPKTMGDRWSSFMKSIIGHTHHERGESELVGGSSSGFGLDMIRRGMRKSRSTGSLSANDFGPGSPTTDAKKHEKDLKKKKKKGFGMEHTNSFTDLHSCESFTRDGTDVAGSGSSLPTRTPDVATPVRAARVVVDPYVQDLWSAGVILFFMLTGRLPFDGRDDEETIHLIEKDVATFDEDEQERISPEARALVLSMLAREPTDRPSIDDIILNRWFATYLDVDALFEDRKDEIKGKLRSAGISVTKSGPGFLEFPTPDMCHGVEEQVIQTAFHKIATDGYGNITRDELRDMMTTLHGDHIEKTDVSELIRLFTGDASSDAITFQQFRDAWVNRDLAHSTFLRNSEFQLANIVGTQMDEVERQLVRQLRAAFDSVNDDHDGMISVSQLRRVFERCGCVATDSDLDSLMAYFDNRPSMPMRSLTDASMDTNWSSPNPSFNRGVSPLSPQSPLVPHEKGITFDAFVQGIVHKDILLRHPLGRRLAAATNLAALFQSHNVTECVRHGFLVSGIQNVILQKLTTVPDRLLLLYTDETVSTTENIYSFRYLGSTALVQGATIETLAPALASSTVMAMSTSTPGFGMSHAGPGPRMSTSRRATLASSAQQRAGGWTTNGASLETPVPSVGDFLSRSNRVKRGELSSSVASPNSQVSGGSLTPWPPAGTLTVKSGSPASPAPLSQSASVGPLSSGTPSALQGGRLGQASSDTHHHPHHHRAHFQHHNQRRASSSQSPPQEPSQPPPPQQQQLQPQQQQQRASHRHGPRSHLPTRGVSSTSLSLKEATPSEDKTAVTGIASPSAHAGSDLNSDDGESQISMDRNSDSIVGTPQSGEASVRPLSSSASLGRVGEMTSVASTSGAAPPFLDGKSPLDSPSNALPTTTAAHAHRAHHHLSLSTGTSTPAHSQPKEKTAGPSGKPPRPSPSSTRNRDNDSSASPSNLQSPRLSGGVGITVPAVVASTAVAQAPPKLGAAPSFGEGLFQQDSNNNSASASTQEPMARSIGLSPSLRGQPTHSGAFPHRSLAFGASGAVAQVSGVCDVDIILAPAFLGYTSVRFRRIHGKTNDFHEAITYVSNLLDVERQQASEDTLPRGESELM